MGTVPHFSGAAWCNYDASYPRISSELFRTAERKRCDSRKSTSAQEKDIGINSSHS